MLVDAALGDASESMPARRFALVTVAALWLLVGVAKILAPGSLAAFLSARTGWSAPSTQILALSIGVLEVAVGLALAMASFRNGGARLALRSSFLLSVVLGAAVLLVKDAGTCGCFGALGAGSSGRKLVFLGSILLLGSFAAAARPPGLQRGGPGARSS